MDTSLTTTGSSTPPPSATTPPSSSGSISADFDTFLQMLTTQLQNQDPLNPVDSSEFAVQLATFAGVEQQVMTNDLLASMTSQMATSGMAEMAAWVGMEARAAAPAYFDGSPIMVAPNPALISDRVELVVRNENGAEVQRMEIPLSAEPIEWAGVTSDGAPMPAGTYSFEVISYAADGSVILQEPAEVYSTVVEVRSQSGEAILIMQGGVAIPATAVSALRDPSLS